MRRRLHRAPSVLRFCLAHLPLDSSLSLAAALLLAGLSVTAASTGGRASIKSGGPEGVAHLHRLGRSPGPRGVHRRVWDSPPAYIGDHLRAWGVAPAGDRASYLQTVRVLGVKATSRSTVTVQVGGETRTFADGEGVTFPAKCRREAAIHRRSRRVRRLRARSAGRTPRRLSAART